MQGLKGLAAQSPRSSKSNLSADNSPIKGCVNKKTSKKLNKLVKELEKQGIGVPMPIEEKSEEKTPAPLALSLSSPYSELSEEEKEDIRINIHIHK